MIRGLEVRKLHSYPGDKGLVIDLWDDSLAPKSLLASTCQSLFPGMVEAWIVHDRASERVICLDGMIKLVAYDAREGSSTKDEICELFLGEYGYREVIIPPGVLRGWKATGNRAALVLSTLEGDGPESRSISREEAAIPYDWKIVMK